nr:hemagglutinin repeat-containing protein [Enterobacter roggenkampii]
MRQSWHTEENKKYYPLICAITAKPSFFARFFCSLSHAAPLTPADPDTVRQQQEELLLKNQQQREELERSIPRPAPARPLPVTGAGPCFTIHTITLSGATLISPKTRQTLVAQAGNDLSLSGTDIRAGKSVSLSGENVLMGVSRDTRDGENHSSSAQNGVTASAGGWAVEAAKAAETAARSAGRYVGLVAHQG